MCDLEKLIEYFASAVSVVLSNFCFRSIPIINRNMHGGGGEGGGWGCQLEPPSCGFLKNVSSKERVKLWYVVTFNIILKHIFSFPQVVQKV